SPRGHSDKGAGKGTVSQEASLKVVEPRLLKSRLVSRRNVRGLEDPAVASPAGNGRIRASDRSGVTDPGSRGSRAVAALVLLARATPARVVASRSWLFRRPRDDDLPNRFLDRTQAGP